MPTERQEVTKAKQRAKRAEQIKDAADKALLRELKSSDAAAVRAALKIWNDRAFEKIEALQAEIDELNKAASLVAETTVPRTEFDAVAAAKTTAESEVQKLKDTMDSACEAERMALQNKTVDIEMREHKVQSAVAEAKQRFDASGLATVITKLQEMVRLGIRTAPDFFKTRIFNPIFWETWSEWEEHAAQWCRLAKDPAFKEEAAVDLLHRGSFVNVRSGPC